MTKRETKKFKTLDAVTKQLFNLGVADFAVKLKIYSIQTGRFEAKISPTELVSAIGS